MIKHTGHENPGAGRGAPSKMDGDACSIIRIKPLKETNLGLAQALFEGPGGKRA